MNTDDEELERMSELLSEHYLDEDQLDYLLDLFVDKAKKNRRHLIDEFVPIEDEFLVELSLFWAADDIKNSEIYRYYRNQVLIKDCFIDMLRDYFIIDMKKV